MPATTPTSTQRLTIRVTGELAFVGYPNSWTNIASGDLPAGCYGRGLLVSLGDPEPMLTPATSRPTDEAIIETAIERVVASAPRLTGSQRERLAIVLGGAAA